MWTRSGYYCAFSLSSFNLNVLLSILHLPISLLTFTIEFATSFLTLIISTLNVAQCYHSFSEIFGFLNTAAHHLQHHAGLSPAVSI